MKAWSPRPCSAITKGGDRLPCKRSAIKGGTRCTLHGGATPTAQQTARDYLLEARVPAARFLRELIEEYRSGPVCSACGRSASDVNAVLKASIAILDRTGHGPRSTLTVEHTDEGSWTRYLTDDEWNAFENIMQAAKERMAANESHPEDTLALPPHIEDAVCVEDDGVPPEGELNADVKISAAVSTPDDDDFDFDHLPEAPRDPEDAA